MIRPTADDAMPLTTPQLLLPINNNCSSSSSSNLREWLVLCFSKKNANISREVRVKRRRRCCLLCVREREMLLNRKEYVIH